VISLSLLERAKFLLREYRIFPKKRLGQNFMVEGSLFPCLADYALLGKSDMVLDVGVGFGFLSRFLAERCRRVLAVELDSRIVKVLREQLVGVANVDVIEGDVLRVQVPSFNKVVSVPPYQISSSLLLWLFERQFDCAVLVFQREFVNRLVASVGDVDYGWLAVVAYYYVDVEVLDDVPRWMFFPRPEVDSVVVRLKPKRSFPFVLKDVVMFRRLVQLMFARRNRKVRNAVLPSVKCIDNISLECAAEVVDRFPFRDRRVRELAPEDFGVLANALVG